MHRRRHESSDEDDEGMYKLWRVYMESYFAKTLITLLELAVGQILRVFTNIFMSGK